MAPTDPFSRSIMVDSGSHNGGRIPVTSSTSSSRPARSGVRVRTKYAPKACQECRRRRAKCGGERPNCSRCHTSQIECIYTTESDGRGTAQKSYVRLLQARVEVLERILSLHSIDIESSVAHLSRRFAQAYNANTDFAPVTGRSSPSVDNHPMSLEGVLTVDEPLNFDRDGEARYFGSTSGRPDFQQQIGLPAPPSPSVSPTNAIQTSEVGDETKEELETHLLDLYFTWEQPWLQVIDETLFRESRRTGGRYCSELLLNSVLANGSRFSDRLDVRTDINVPNSAGRAFLDRAEILVHSELKQPGITTLQALTVMGTVCIAIGQDAAGWMYHGMARTLLFDLGLNIDPSALPSFQHMTSAEAELRRQIYWSLYCVDKLASGYTGRVCMMLDFQAAVNLPSLPIASPKSSGVDAERFARKFRLVSFHNALIALCKILEEIFIKLYTINKWGPEEQRRAVFDTYKLSLRSWFYKLPEELKFHKPAAHQRVLPQVVALQMVYHTSVILLAKPFVCRDPAYTEDNEDPDESSSTEFRRTAIALYKGAAREVSVLADQYREVFGSFRLSPITPTHSTLMASLALLSSCPKASQGTNTCIGTVERLGSCLRTLDELSTAWTPAQRYHESLIRLVKERGLEIPNINKQTLVTGVLNEQSSTQWPETFDLSMNWNPSGEDSSWLTWLSMIDMNWGDIEGMGLFDLPLEVGEGSSQDYPSSMPWQ